ncbi:hypothetical protein, partial [Ferrimicrobium acidiphilum]|uniref:hypothetical protein n=1 Tax=Ferrimicrobium acidiphilum TaxID=121039 RepID=UPI0023F3FED6
MTPPRPEGRSFDGVEWAVAPEPLPAELGDPHLRPFSVDMADIDGLPWEREPEFRRTLLEGGRPGGV